MFPAPLEIGNVPGLRLAFLAELAATDGAHALRGGGEGEADAVGVGCGRAVEGEVGHVCAIVDVVVVGIVIGGGVGWRLG